VLKRYRTQRVIRKTPSVRLDTSSNRHANRLPVLNRRPGESEQSDPQTSPDDGASNQRVNEAYSHDARNSGGCRTSPTVEPLLQWWQACRPFFREHASEIVSQIDDDADRLAKLAAADQTFCVCVLGQSAVGKSTLLNAIVAGDNMILPAGGVGPLTALATEVRFSKESYLLVTYRTPKHLSGFRLQLEKELKRRDRDFQLIADEESTNVDNSQARTIEIDVQELGSDPQAKRAQDRTLRDLCAQVSQILTGNQFKELPLEQIIIGLRAVLGLKIDSLTTFSDEDRSRISSAAEAVEKSNSHAPTRYSKRELGQQFDQVLYEHVSGHLSPLVERIEVGYPFSNLSTSVVLIDLPGVGIANDRYRTITSEYVRLKARAIILVVDRAGLTEASVDLIRDSGYWDRLLLSSADPERDQCELVIAVTKVDDVAKATFAKQKHLPKEQRTSKDALFRELQDEVREAIRSQADSCFHNLTIGVSDDQDVISARVDAQSTMMHRLRIFPVSAIEYSAFLAGDDDDRPFIHDLDASVIPALTRHLEQLAASHRERLAQATEDVSERLMRTIRATLTQVSGSWTSASRVAEEAEALREELERFLEPKRRELENRKGAFREFLDQAGTSRIAELVAKAQLTAQQEVASYLRALRDVHWATLRATVVRGGAFVSGRGIRVDLAADVAQRFQEPMASLWGRTLLKDIRKRTREHGTILEGIIADVCEWAENRSDTTVQRDVLRAQQLLMRDRVVQLADVGSEAVDDLKEAIKRDLMATIEGPIRAQCEAFQKRGDAIGPGVKQRIVALFDALASDAVAAAAAPATVLLKGQFVKVRIDIAKPLEEWGDPIDQASDAIIEREEQRRQRSDARRRKHILAQVQHLSEQMPIISA
jgi:GTP-binding protein EngB required for normal cell division